MAFHPNILLGIPDEAIIPENDLRNGWTTNKFGGTPNWMQGPPAEYPQCSLCGLLLPQVAQIYCPSEHSLFHRVLYIFGCTNNSCWGKKQSWKVLRCQKCDESVQTKVSHNIEEKDNWCDEDDEWGEEETDDQATQSMSALKEIEQQTRNLNLTDGMGDEETSLKSMNHSHPEQDEQFVKVDVKQFAPYYINVIEESQFLSEEKTLSRSEKKLLVEYQKREGLHDIEEILESSTQGWGGEKYEQGHAKHGDKIFHKFLKQVNLCNEQCLRYSLNGNPLLITAENLGEIPCCSSCGKERVFEIQLMPALVLLLQINKKYQNAISQTATHTHGTSDGDSEKYHQDSRKIPSYNIEFGTVYIYTCSDSCWSDDAMYQEEYLVIHSDPDQKHISQF